MEGDKIFLVILKFVGNYRRFLSKIGRFSKVLRIELCVLRGFEILHYFQNDKVCTISNGGQHEHQTIT